MQCKEKLKVIVLRTECRYIARDSGPEWKKRKLNTILECRVDIVASFVVASFVVALFVVALFVIALFVHVNSSALESYLNLGNVTVFLTFP